MSRRKKGQKINGWINLYKPKGMTSTQAVSKVRWLFDAQKAGHAGTLDPLADGVLPIALGEATKTIPYIQDSLKTYEFTIGWGAQYDTDDLEGQIIASSDVRPEIEAIQSALPSFTGSVLQTPPRFSAIKINGERAYDLARDGEDFAIEPKDVYIETLELVEATSDNARLVMTCGKGTYVRSLARDLALKLGTFGYVSALRRTKVGSFGMKDAILLDKLENLSDIPARIEVLLPLEASLDDIPALPLKSDEAAKLKSGQVLKLTTRPDFERLDKAGLHGKSEAFAKLGSVAIALVEVDGVEIRPVRVFNI